MQPIGTTSVKDAEYSNTRFVSNDLEKREVGEREVRQKYHFHPLAKERKEGEKI